MPSDKLESDAKRAKSRGFGGYLVDRIGNRADFEKAAPNDAAAESFQQKTLRDRMKDAGAMAPTDDPTHVAYGGNAGSSVHGRGAA